MDFLPAYFLIATVLIAAATDVLTHRIPNNLLAPALVLALLTGIATGGATGLMLSLAGLVVDRMEAVFGRLKEKKFNVRKNADGFEIAFQDSPC